MARPFALFGLVLCVWRASAAVTLDETEYLADFGSDSPAIQALAAPLWAAQGAERTTRTLFNPILSVEREAPGDVEQLTYGLGWVPPLDRRRGPSVEAARAAVEAARGELDWGALEVRATLREAYADWALAFARVAIVQSQLATFRTIVQKAQERSRIGEESGLAAQRLALALAEFEAGGARAEADLAERRALALGRMSAPHDDPQPALPELPEVGATPDSSVHPLVRARRAQVEEAEARARLGRRFFHSPEVQVGWQTLHDRNSDSEGLVLGAAWAVPLFDRRQGERVEWEGRTRAARAQLEVQERLSRATVAGAEASYRRLRESALATARALEGSEQVLDRVMARFQMGESNVTDLLDAVRSVVSSRLAGLDLYGAALESHRQLELARGYVFVGAQGGGR